MDPLGPILVPEEAATLLRCTARTVEDRLRAGDLPGEKFGEGWILPTQALLQRINEIALEKMIERRNRQEKAPAFALVENGGRRAPPALQ